MFISGVAGKFNKDFKPGDAVPFDTASKVREAAKRAWVSMSPEGEMHVVCDVQLSTEPEVLSGQPTHYKCKTKVSYWRLRGSDDTLLSRRDVDLEVLLADTTDQRGMPDIKVVSFNKI